MIKVGYQGVLGSFSSIASKRLFPDANLISYISFFDVMENVENGNLDFGVLPIENSFAGEVSRVLDGLYKFDVRVNEVYDLPIIQNLIGIKGTKLSEIKEVYSHEQALMQSSEFLKSLNCEVISYANTAMAAKMVSDLNDKSKAAIASSATAELYDLEILQEKINNVDTNTTRFVVISKQPLKPHNEFSFIFTLIDGAGALAKILNEISKYKINLTMISSRARHDLPWNYYFYCEAMGSIEDENVKKMCDALTKKCKEFKLTGSY